jgi:ADP-specific Phosphofructokinase/Glucokinase conserved region
MFRRNLLFKGVIALGTLIMVTNYQWLLRGLIRSPPTVEGETKLSQDVVRRMLSVYNDYAGNISTEKNKYIPSLRPRVRKLLFAFVSDNDMVVNAVDLMRHLECKADYPHTFHRSLATDQEVCETILFFFTRGLGSELYVTNRPEFDAVIELANKVKKKEDLGGNSAQMALRAFKEGADVYLNSMMSRYFYEHLFNSSISIVPESHLS